MQDSVETIDFSGDDFANDKQIQKLRAEAKAYEMMVDESLSIIEERFDITESSHRNLKKYDMIKGLLATINYSTSSKIENRSLHVSLVTYSSSFSTARSSNCGTDQYLVGFLECRNDYPRSYIYKESIKEKLVDLVLKRDIDFQNSKRFSRNFEVLTEDRKRLHDLLHLSDLNGLADFPDMEVELYGYGLVFRNSRKPISIKEATSFAKLIPILSKAFA